MAAVAVAITWFASRSAILCCLVLICLLLTHIGLGLMSINDLLGGLADWLVANKAAMDEANKTKDEKA